MAKTTLNLEARRPQSAAPPPHEELYAKRRKIYPKLAHGKFRSLKWLAMGILLTVFYALPWLRWDRGEGVPNQAVLADFPTGRFYFFFLEIWPQQIHYMAALLIMAAIGLFLVTAMFGRVWCGYTCPQTVWTDLYIWVERAFEGDRAARMRLDKAPMSLNKALRKIGKHLVWILIAFATGGMAILYWHDAPTLARTFYVGKAPMTAYVFAGSLTLITYLLAGLMREQVCTYMCPWPRIQGALTDEYALNVTYRYDRGEPRGPKRKNQSWEGRGDCIDCDQCVQVCPMGIDIRDGEQLECIHCALCIDACDAMMKRIGRPTGLIAYDTTLAVKERSEGKKPVYKLLRARTLLYAGLLLIIGSITLNGLLHRASFEVNTLKDRSPIFVRLAEGGIRNGYTLKLVNKTAEKREMRLVISGLEGAELGVVGLENVSDTEVLLPVAPHGVDRYRVVITAPDGIDVNQKRLKLSLIDTATQEEHSNSVSFSGPGDE